MEQMESYMKENGTTEIPTYNLPSKIICTVLHVELKVEPGTDEIFAQITLLPEAEQNELSLEHTNYQALPRPTNSRFFRKNLTLADISTHGALSVLKRHACDGCLPLLDMSQQTPQQELLTTDLHGHRWCFRHVFRGQPKRHLFTSGWSNFVTSNKLDAGDTFIFLRGENGEFGVGVRRAMPTLLNNQSPIIISGHNIRHGILANAFRAFSTRSMFTIDYRPWTRSSEFITPLDQYLKVAEFSYCIGTRFRMRFKDEESMDQRALGTIIGIQDLDHIRWSNSKWRCLKVKWDLTMTWVLLPERVCPWSIEPTELTKKRARPNDASSPVFSSSIMDGMLHGSTKYQSQSSLGVLQGQEDGNTCTTQSGELRLSLLHFLPQNPCWSSMQHQKHEQLEIQVPICSPFCQYISSTMFSADGIHDDARACNKFSIPVRNENETLIHYMCTMLHKMRICQ